MQIYMIVCALCVADALGVGMAAAVNSTSAPLNTSKQNLKFGLWQFGILFASNGNNATAAENAMNEVKFEPYDKKPAWLKATIAVALVGWICLVAVNAIVLRLFVIDEGLEA